MSPVNQAPVTSPIERPAVTPQVAKAAPISSLLILDQKFVDNWYQRKYQTPRVLWAWFGGISLFAVFLTLASVFAINDAQTELKTVCVDSAPSVIAAQQIRANMSDLDGAWLTQFLDTSDVSIAASNLQMSKDASVISEQLVVAAKNITYDGEEKSITVMVQNFSNYQALMAEAKTLHQHHLEAEALVKERAAATIMQDTLLFQAENLDSINDDKLKAAYESSRTYSTVTFVIVMLAGIGLCAVLVQAQLWLYDKTHRAFNPGLVVATCLAAVLLVSTCEALHNSSGSLKGAAKDAFDSIHALLKARSEAMDANAAESRWLYDPDPSERSTAAGMFIERSTAIAFLPANTTYEDLATTFRTDDKTTHVSGFAGRLADELANITYTGEREAALDTLVKWGSYMDLDTQIRSLERTFQHPQAVALCLDQNVGGSDYAFAQFDASLQNTIKINTDQFEANRDSGTNATANMAAIDEVLAVLIVASTFAGLWPRMKEYRA